MILLFLNMYGNNDDISIHIYIYMCVFVCVYRHIYVLFIYLFIYLCTISYMWGYAYNH